MTTTTAKRQPSNWTDYEFGRSPSQSFIEPAVDDSEEAEQNANASGFFADAWHHGTAQLQRRRSSFNLRIASLRQAGGVNSIDNFARSWSRAAGFPEINPARRNSFVLEESGVESPVGIRVARDEEAAVPHKSLLRQQLEASPEYNSPIRGEASTHPRTTVWDPHPEAHVSSPSDEVTSLLTPPGALLSRSYGTSYGSISSRVTESSARYAEALFEEHRAAAQDSGIAEDEPLLVKQIQHEDGTKSNVVVGRSTLPQTIFNSVNVLIGVGLLALPLGVKYAGWIVGMLFLVFAAIVTAYTAKLLAICLDVDPSLVTYADVAYISFGPRARIVTSFFFSLELIAASVALVVLFADSLDALIGGLSIISWKVICGLILMPLNFIPLRFLSVTSILGILCAFGIVLIVFIDGLAKVSSPGSLRMPAMTYVVPKTWMTLPLSFGLFMAPWGGHSVFPNIYRDMRHPAKYTLALKYTYVFTYLVDLAMAVIGYLMFGEETRDEITSNVLLSSGYPKILSLLIVVFIALIPLTKVPLSCRPIVSTIEVLGGLDHRVLSADSRMHEMSPALRNLFKAAIRIGVIVVIVLISILFPDFDSIMALMGSALCFTICIVLPCSFYLKIFGGKISLRERMLNWFLIVSCGAMAITGTVWAILPKSQIGAE